MLKLTGNKAEISLSFIVTDSNTPELPGAQRGAVSDRHVAETDEQLKGGLVWWPCGFCGRFVLIDAYRNTREKCTCGAERRNRYGNAYWIKNGEIVEYI